MSGYSSGSKAPKLNIKGKEIVIQAGKPIRLTCSGEENVFWKVPAINGKENKRLHITPNVCEGTVCRRRLVLSKAQINDTGFYSCEFSSSFTPAARKNKFPTSVYIFITEKTSPFVELYSLIPMLVDLTDGQELVIPCRTTSPNITVTLKKTYTNQILIPDGKNIIWDNKRGFIIPKPTYRFSDLLSCEATINRSADDTGGSVISTKYLINRISSAIHNVTLDKPSSVRLLSGNSLSIKCTVTTDLNARAQIQWDYPGLQYGKLASIIHRIDRTNPNSILSYSILFINDVRRINDGKYICTAKNGPSIKSADTTVHIHAKPLLKVKPRIKGILQAVAGQKSYRISVKVRAFPSPEVRWLKDDLLAADKCSRYIVNNNFLIIKDVAEEDAGIYTISLHLKQANLTTNLSMKLIVKAKPQIYKLSGQDSHLYALGSKQSITCLVYGTPPPQITWTWQPCTHNHSREKCDIPSDNSKNSVPLVTGKNISHLGNRIQSITQRTQMIEGKNKTVGILVIEDSRTSGIYTCMATNEVGSERKHITYYVTDVPNGFHIRQNKEPTEGEDLILSCSVNKYLYTDISWTFSRTVGNHTMHHSISKQRDAVTAEYSTTLTALIKNATQADSGVYQCRAKNIYTGDIVPQCKDIIIRGEKNRKTPLSRTTKSKRRKSNCTTESSAAH
ncbi:vascular endothelial growth factor receptor 1 [Pelodytes ibericus]